MKFLNSIKKYSLHLLIIFLTLLFVFSFITITLPYYKFLTFSDKIHHFIAYLIFTLLLSAVNPFGIFKQICVILATGLLIEVLQALYGHGRMFSIYDLLANIVGVIFGLLIIYFYKSLITRISKKL